MIVSAINGAIDFKNQYGMPSRPGAVGFKKFKALYTSRGVIVLTVVF
jgi:hypothetical protein